MQVAKINQKVGAYLKLMRFDRPIGTLLLLWPTCWALWVAAGAFPPSEMLFIFIAGVVLMRAAGCVINDFADRNFDGEVSRTQARPLVTQCVTPKEALGLFVVLCVAAFMLVLLLNKLTIGLSIVALVLAVCYPFTKRIFVLPQLVLGLAFSWSIIMVFAALTQHVPLVAWLLFLANVCWIMAYDTQYALADREDDRKLGIYSSALFFDRFDQIAIGVFQLCMVLILVVIGLLQAFNWVYYCALMFAMLLMIYQFFLVKQQKSAQYLRAFFNNNWVGAVILLGIVLS